MREHFKTDADGDLIMRVVAAHQKNETKYDVPIPDTPARELAPIIARTPHGKRLFPMKRGSGAEMIRADLKTAGLAELDEEGNQSVTRPLRTPTTCRGEEGAGKAEEAESNRDRSAGRFGLSWA